MDYASLRDSLVIPKLKEFGKSVTIRRPGSATGWTKAYDPIEGRYYWTLVAPPHSVVYADPATSPLDYAGYGVETAYEQTEIDGTVIKAGDRRFKVASIPEPSTSDKLVVSSTVLNIVSIIPVQPGDVTLLWVIQCRA
jgi:hypothetical protein